MNEFFSVSHLQAGYGSRPVVQDVSFSVGAGELLGVLGANGCGKTTLLKAVCGILPHQGSCQLDGRPLEPMTPRQLTRHCSYIPQRSGISIDISVLDVVLMGFNPWLGLLERPTAEMRDKACRALARVGLAGREQDNYLHLSEGQKQLCMLARTLTAGGSLLLLDEPESALDFRYRYRMLELLRQWTGQKQRAAVVTLHDASLALNYCDRLLILSQGRASALLTPAADSPEQMEKALSAVYGSISLARCKTRSGRTQLVMLKEEDPQEDCMP